MCAASSLLPSRFLRLLSVPAAPGETGGARDGGLSPGCPGAAQTEDPAQNADAGRGERL